MPTLDLGLPLDLQPAAAPDAVVLLEVLVGMSVSDSGDCLPGIALGPGELLLLDMEGGAVSEVPDLHFAEVPEYTGDIVRVAYGPPGPAGSRPKSPTLTYTGELLTAISYADGTSKALSYDASGRLVQVDFDGPVVRTRTHLAYDAAGRLVSALETVL